MTSGAAVARHSRSTATAIADLNGDGNLDIFVANSGMSGPGNNELLLGDGNGNFEEVTTGVAVARRAYWYAVAIADVNIDGNPDIFVVAAWHKTRSGVIDSKNELLLGDGLGNFTAVTSGAAASSCTQAGERGCRNSRGVAIADVNGDGNPDIFVANDGRGVDNGHNELLLGDGSGNFTAVTSGAAVARTDRSQSAAIADVNGDGHPDIFVVNNGHNELLLGDGSGNFTAVTSGAAVARSDSSNSAAIADVNGDGHPDIFVA
eukprot:COSAG01_NODE_14700_length_1420_cov_2.310371_1_plen_261_part_01